MDDDSVVSSNDDEEKDESTTIDNTNAQGFNVPVTFIDVLFAIVVSLGFSQIMTRPWFNSTSWDVVPAYIFEIATILLGYSTLLFSWWGYHRSIQRRNILAETWSGKASFVVDILILVGYWLLLVKFQSFFFVLCVLVAIYGLYVVWDHLRMRRERETTPFQWQRRAVTTLWTLILTGILITYMTLGLNDSPLTLGDWVFLGLAHSVNVLYRLNKVILFPKPLLNLLAYRPMYRGI